MPLEFTRSAEEVEQLPEAERADWVEDPTDNTRFVHSAVAEWGSGVKSALQKERDRAEQAEKRAAELEHGGKDALREELRAEFEDERRAFAEDKRRHKRDRAIEDAVIEHDGHPRLLSAYLREHVDVDDNGAVVVKGQDGKARLDENGDPVPLSAFVKGMREDPSFADVFASRQRNGGGSNSDGNGPQYGERLKRGDMSKTEKVRFIRTHGEAEFMKLPL